MKFQIIHLPQVQRIACVGFLLCELLQRPTAAKMFKQRSYPELHSKQNVSLSHDQRSKSNEELMPAYDLKDKR